MLRALAATILLTAAMLLPTALRPTSAVAAEPEAFVSIQLTSINPALPTPTSTVTLTGKVTNTSDLELHNLQAILWRAPNYPILNAEELTRSLDRVANDPLGARLTENHQNIPSETDRTLAPGESATFTLQATVPELGFPLADSVYLVGVHVRGRLTSDGVNFTLGRARAFLPMQTVPPANTLQMTSVVILNSRPALLGKSEFVDDHLASEVATGGRLDRLIQGADAADTSFAVDPEMIQALRIMKAGYTVRGSDGSTAAGQAAADRWLEKFESVKGKRDGFRLLFGSPDIAALVHGGQSELLTQAALAGRMVEGMSGLPLLVLPARGMADKEILSAAEELNPAAILISDVSTGQSRPLLTGQTDAPVVSFTADSTGGGPGPDPRNTAVHVQQRMLAETWIEASAAPAGATLGRVRLVTSAAQLSGDGRTANPPWIKRGTLSELLRSDPASWNLQLSYPKAAGAGELRANQLRMVRLLARSYDTYTELLAEPDAANVEAATSLARATSSKWRRAVGPMRSFIRPQQAELDTILDDKIEVRASRRVTTVSRQGSFPITVRNTLPAPENPASLTNAVRVRLVFRSQVGQRLTVEPIDVDVIRAGANFSGAAQVDAAANGTVPVTAQVTTTSGRPIGQPVTIQVTATQAGTTGWIIVLISGPVLIGGVALRIRQVARERAAASQPPQTPPGLSSGPPASQISESVDV
jgi:hypothetical protein